MNWKNLFKRKSNRIDIKKVFSGDEIYFKDLFLIFWERKWYFVISIVFFIWFASMSYKTIKPLYSASQTLLHENTGEDNIPGSGLAALLGLGGGQASVSSFTDPSFYPSIVASQVFLLELMEEQFYFQSAKDTLSLFEFFKGYDDRTWTKKKLDGIVSTPNRIISWFKSIGAKENVAQSIEEKKDHLRRIDPARLGVIGKLEDKILIGVGGNLITVTTIMPEPELSAQFNEVVLEKLLEYVKLYKTKKETDNLKYVESRTVFAEKKYLGSRKRLAEFIDGNQGLATAAARIQQERLTTINSINAGIYTELATELERSRLTLQEKLPVYSVFEPVYVPLGASNISKKVYFVNLAIGLLFAFSFICGEVLFKVFR